MKFLLFALLGLAVTSSCEAVRFHGEITLPADAPDSFPAGSHLYVKLATVSMADAESVPIAQGEVDLSQYRKGQPLSYSIDVEETDLKKAQASSLGVGGVLNVGWTPTGEPWVRKGDFLTDTLFVIHTDGTQQDYRKDFNLVKY